MSNPIKTLTVDGLKRNVQYKHPGMKKTTPVFLYGDTVKGKFAITPVNHSGVSVSLIGSYLDGDGHATETFFVKTLQLLPPAELKETIEAPYSFPRVQFPCTTYIGKKVSVCYCVEMKVETSGKSFVLQKPIYVVKPIELEEVPFCKSVGLQELVHVVILLKSTRIDCRRVIMGALYFTLAKLRMIDFVCEMHRTEITEGREEMDELLGSCEVMDGSPVKGTIIPIRFYLSGMNCWPSPKSRECKVDCHYCFVLRGHDETGAKYVRRVPLDIVYEK